MAQAWIGLVEVGPKAGCDVLEGAVGAYVNVVALAADQAGFEQVARDTLDEYNLHVVAITDIGLVSERAANGDLVDDLERLAAALTEEYPIQFDEFQAFEAE